MSLDQLPKPQAGGSSNGFGGSSSGGFGGGGFGSAPTEAAPEAAPEADAGFGFGAGQKKPF